MKILLSADWHIKIGAKNVPISWAVSRFREMFKQLHEIEKDADIHVVAGDIFDKLPSMEELSLYFEFIKSSTIKTFIIPGNHESVKKDTTFFTYLKEVTNSINPLVTIIDDYYVYKEIDFLPYNKLKEYEKNTETFTFTNNVLITHCRAEIPPHVKPEVDLSIFDRWQTVLAGDLHSYDNCQRNILYPGSPVTTSFHRGVVDTGVILFDTDTHVHEWIKLKLPQLIRKTIKAGEPMEATDYHHTIYEVEGDMTELGGLQDSDLIDKKIVKRQSDVALILDADMTLAEELKEYLLYILMLDEATTEELVKILNNNMSKINV